MKKLVLLILSLLLVLTLAACGSRNPSNTNSSANPSENSFPSENKPSENQGEAAGKKTLIVYFSATGSTKKAAEYIASATNGDLFELTPVNAYSASDLDWTDESSRVVTEHNNPNSRNIALVAATVDNWDEYDTVFIGFPIWWGIAAWPVNSFIEANDFTGKTVIPFCTSSSSGLGQSGELLKEMAGTGNWLEGRRFSSGASESEVQKWVETLTI